MVNSKKELSVKNSNKLVPSKFTKYKMSKKLPKILRELLLLLTIQNLHFLFPAASIYLSEPEMKKEISLPEPTLLSQNKVLKVNSI